MRIDRPRRARRLISLTPLIDVVFILLMFVMLTSNFLQWRAYPLAMSAVDDAGTQAGSALSVRLTEDGALALDGERLALAALAARLRPLLRSHPQRRVLVRSHPRVAVQRIVSVLDRLRQAGVRNVALAGERP